MTVCVFVKTNSLFLLLDLFGSPILYYVMWHQRGIKCISTDSWNLWKTEAVFLFPGQRLHPVEPALLRVFCLRREGQASVYTLWLSPNQLFGASAWQKTALVWDSVTDSRAETLQGWVGGGAGWLLGHTAAPGGYSGPGGALEQLADLAGPLVFKVCAGLSFLLGR